MKKDKLAYRLIYEDFSPKNLKEYVTIGLAKAQRELKKKIGSIKPFSGRKLNFYFLSTGRCGTRFYARLLDLANNAIVFHEPTPHLMKEAHAASDLYKQDFAAFARLNIKDF